MQTFLPYYSFILSAKALDKKRCWKQVVEAHQIIGTLELKQNKHKNQLLTKIPWENHPAVKMWEGYTFELKVYFNAFLKISKENHNINTKYEYYDVPPQSMVQDYEFPWWLGNEKFHRAMRSRLIEKNYDFYYPLWPEDIGYNNSKYFWPNMETKTFKII